MARSNDENGNTIPLLESKLSKNQFKNLLDIMAILWYDCTDKKSGEYIVIKT